MARSHLASRPPSRQRSPAAGGGRLRELGKNATGQRPQNKNLEDSRSSIGNLTPPQGRPKAHPRAILAEIEDCEWWPGGPASSSIAESQERVSAQPGRRCVKREPSSPSKTQVRQVRQALAQCPRRSAQLVNSRTPFPPETPSKTRDGGVGKQAAGI